MKSSYSSNEENIGDVIFKVTLPFPAQILNYSSRVVSRNLFAVSARKGSISQERVRARDRWLKQSIGATWGGSGCYDNYVRGTYPLQCIP